MQDVVRAHVELRIIGSPSFCFSFTSDEFDIYHLNDAMQKRGWRLNGQQYPNAVHMAVTRPQTQEGVLEAWTDDIPRRRRLCQRASRRTRAELVRVRRSAGADGGSHRQDQHRQ